MVRKRIVAIILAAAVAGMSYSAYAMDCEEQIVSEEIVTEEISENEMPEEETADISEETVEAAEESIESGDSDAPETQSDVTLSSNSVTYGSVTLSVNASYCTYTDQNGYYALVYTSNMGTLTTKGTLNIQHTSDVRYEYFGSKLLPGKYSYVVVDGVPYSYGNDYKVSFKNNKHAGEMTITVKFKKNTTPYSNGIKKIVETVTIRRFSRCTITP